MPPGVASESPSPARRDELIRIAVDVFGHPADWDGLAWGEGIVGPNSRTRRLITIITISILIIY